MDGSFEFGLRFFVREPPNNEEPKQSEEIAACYLGANVLSLVLGTEWWKACERQNVRVRWGLTRDICHRDEISISTAGQGCVAQQSRQRYKLWRMIDNAWSETHMNLNIYRQLFYIVMIQDNTVTIFCVTTNHCYSTIIHCWYVQIIKKPNTHSK